MADRTPPRPGRPDRSGTGRASGGKGTGGGARSGSATPRTGPVRAGAPRAGAPRAGAPRSSGPRTGPTRGGTSAKPGPGRPGPGKERPALAARARTRQPAPPSQSTAWVRGAILLGIVVMLAVTLVPTLRSVIQQRNDTAALRDQVAEQEQVVADLKREAALWRDPAYIEVQARERLKFVRIGDRAYTVLNLPDQSGDATQAPRPIVAAPMANADAPWYGKLWQSIQIADRPTEGIAR